MKKYNNLDGLRTIAALGVILMHIRSNIGYEIIGGGITNYVVNHLVAQFGIFVQLFFVISGFGICCGYYEKIKNGRISLDKFYSKRYLKILPFFVLLMIVDLGFSFMSHELTLGSIVEAFTQATLVFGFAPAYEVTVIGVSWTLGVIFGFYILFPFYVFLIWTKRRAWVSFIISVVLNWSCQFYFIREDGNPVGLNLVRWMCFFIAGGLIYLYKEKIEKLMCSAGVGLIMVTLGFCITFIIPLPVRIGTIKNLTGFSLMVMGVLGADTKIWSNTITKFISKISLEIYLAHMVIFRVIQKMSLTIIAGESLVSYIITCILTIVGVAIFAEIYIKIENTIKRKVLKNGR